MARCTLPGRWRRQEKARGRKFGAESVPQPWDPCLIERLEKLQGSDRPRSPEDQDWRPQ